MKPESNRPITIEDLLRLKRAERPPAEFWSEFDTKLRAKQLAALVEKRPWWQSLPGLASGLYRYRIAFGTAAICVLSVLSLRQYGSSGSPVETPIVSDTAVAAAPVAVGETVNAAPAVLTIESSPSRPAVVASSLPVSTSEARELDALVSSPATDALHAEGISQLIAAGGPVVTANESEASAASAQHLAGSLVQVGDRFVSSGLLSGASSFESRAMPARAPVEPLQQMTPPSDTRRSRLLTAMVSSASFETSAQTTERAASRMISDERTYDQIHRFGARGDRVQVRF